MFSQVNADEADLFDGLEPSADELEAIEAEMPLIEAEMAVTDAQIRIVTVTSPSPLDWRALRRAERRVLAAAVSLYEDASYEDAAAA